MSLQKSYGDLELGYLQQLLQKKVFDWVASGWDDLEDERMPVVRMFRIDSIDSFVVIVAAVGFFALIAVVELS